MRPLCEPAERESFALNIRIFARVYIYLVSVSGRERERNVYSFIFLPLLRLLSAFSDEFHSEEMKSPSRTAALRSRDSI